MINSVNSLEFLKSKLLTMEKYSSTTNSKLLPPSSFTQAETYDSLQENFLFNNEIKNQDRVRVQHLENHTNLQNNTCCNNFRSLYDNISASSNVRERKLFHTNQIKDDSEIDVVNVEHLNSITQIPLNIQNKSAFNIDFNNKYQNKNRIAENNNDNAKINTLIVNETKKFYCNGLTLQKSDGRKMFALAGETEINTTDGQRTEDQDNAYRHIESVHNYAKSKSFEGDDYDKTSPNGSRHSIYVSDDEEEDDEENGDTDHIDYEDRLPDDLDADYEDIFNKRRYRRLEKLSPPIESASINNNKLLGNRAISAELKKPPNFVDILKDHEIQHLKHINIKFKDEQDLVDVSINNVKLLDNQGVSTEQEKAPNFVSILKDNKIQHLKPNNIEIADEEDHLDISTNNKLLDNRGISVPNFVNILKNHKMQHSKLNNIKIEDEEDHVDVDVETVEPQLSPITSVMETNSLLANNCTNDGSAVFVKPDHHARRPMNAFLIFCKRHRAIVKDRYRNLENRAITKILGDWWASLESSEKKCFTNLAQQNKDAFFSANPNFKWYKLPAPPLRTLATRPANTFGHEFQEDNSFNGLDMISNIASYNHNHTNYFKLADEAHMGDLSQLMQDKSKTIRQCADLQQALGETSQFMSTHITCTSEVLDENHLKRRFYSENSFSSNSSEEDVVGPTKKSARTCKGKRYQELINSGQIATGFKKAKSLARPFAADVVSSSETNPKQNCLNVYNLNNVISNDCQKRSLSESEGMITYDINSFDLEEKIKELPALNLDDYLQRKRNTKKKKKFSSNGKKRGQRSVNNKNNQIVTTFLQNQETDIADERLGHQLQLVKQYQQQPITAVGSQKRKARKESITRRDVSAIEQEVTSLLPLTINGCCYFQEAPTAIKIEKTYENDTEGCNTATQSPFLTPTSPTIPIKQDLSSPVSIDIFNNSNVRNSDTLNDNISSSTSDLLILAEVAANRTELKD